MSRRARFRYTAEQRVNIWNEIEIITKGACSTKLKTVREFIVILISYSCRTGGRSEASNIRVGRKFRNFLDGFIRQCFVGFVIRMNSKSTDIILSTSRKYSCT